jgi:hypothetical protein
MSDHCSPLAARMKNAMIAASAQTPAARTPATPAKNPTVNKLLIGLPGPL